MFNCSFIYLDDVIPIMTDHERRNPVSLYILKEKVLWHHYLISLSQHTHFMVKNSLSSGWVVHYLSRAVCESESKGWTRFCFRNISLHYTLIFMFSPHILIYSRIGYDVITSVLQEQPKSFACLDNTKVQWCRRAKTVNACTWHPQDSPPGEPPSTCETCTSISSSPPSYSSSLPPPSDSLEPPARSSRRYPRTSTKSPPHHRRRKGHSESPPAPSSPRSRESGRVSQSSSPARKPEDPSTPPQEPRGSPKT